MCDLISFCDCFADSQCPFLYCSFIWFCDLSDFVTIWSLSNGSDKIRQGLYKKQMFSQPITFFFTFSPKLSHNEWPQASLPPPPPPPSGPSTSPSGSASGSTSSGATYMTAGGDIYGEFLKIKSYIGRVTFGPEPFSLMYFVQKVYKIFTKGCVNPPSEPLRYPTIKIVRQIIIMKCLCACVFCPIFHCPS